MNITGDEYQPYNNAISGTAAEMQRHKKLLDAIMATRQVPQEAAGMVMPEMDLTDGDAATPATGGVVEPSIGGVDPKDVALAQSELLRSTRAYDDQNGPGLRRTSDGKGFLGEDMPDEAPAPLLSPMAASQPGMSGDERQLFNAQEADRSARLRQGIELAGRQLVGGITHTQVGQGMPAESSQVPLVLSAQAARRKSIADEIARKRQAGIDDDMHALHESTIERNSYEIGPEKRALAVAEALRRQKEKDEDDAESKRRFEISSTNSKDNAAATRALAGAGLSLRRDEFDDKKDEREEKKADKKKKELVDVESSNIPFAAGRFKPRAGTKPDDISVRNAQKDAGLYGAAITGIDGLKAALGRFANKPGAATKDDVVAQVRAVSSAMNAAVGQGAMSGDEAKQNEKALGADLLSAAGVEAFIGHLMGDSPENTAAVIGRRADSVKKQLHSQAISRLKSSNFEWQTGEDSAAGSQTKIINGITWKKVNGGWQEVAE